MSLKNSGEAKCITPANSTNRPINMPIRVQMFLLVTRRAYGPSQVSSHTRHDAVARQSGDLETD